jgi:transposase InsO family protein
MEHEWELDRVKLFQLRRQHPKWTLPRLAYELKRSLSWVKKWLKRFRGTEKPTLEMFKSKSRAPHHRPRQVVDEVRDAIVSLRDELKELYKRVVGPKTILYHLHRDQRLQGRQLYIPRSTSVVWRVLKEGGRIPTQVREHHPVVRPQPLQHWEMDFGQLGEAFEFLTVIDRGTSILINTQTYPHYNAETALLAVARFLIAAGLPQKLRFDNDPRFVGNWLTDGYPSPLMKFLWCVGVEPDLVEPGNPYHKPFAERSVRTLKHECLWVDRPADWLDAAGGLEVFMQFYNHDRANQSLACNNRPPYEAFPNLPPVPHVPEMIDPDGWLNHYHQRIFRRRVAQSGTISVGKHDYYVGYPYAGQRVGVVLDAKLRVFRITQGSTVIGEKEIQGLLRHPMPFQEYLKHMLKEAQTAALVISR